MPSKTSPSKRLRHRTSHFNHYVYLYVLAAIALIFLLLYRLGGLVGGMSTSEIVTAHGIYGWHGLTSNILYLPINLIRSIDFKLFPNHGQTLTRLPSALFGLFSVVSFSYIIYIWHGKRTSLLSTLLFITAAWGLHVSRLATNDIMFFWGIISLILTQVLLSEYSGNALVTMGSFFIWGLLLTIPGFLYLLILFYAIERNLILDALSDLKSWSAKLISFVLLLLWVPLIAHHLINSAANIRNYLGLPATIPTLSHYLKDFIAVGVHLFIRGPEYPDIWLGKSPILDFFTVVLAILGIYFYFKHFASNRSKLLYAMFVCSYILVSFSGSIPLSLLVPLVYVFAATGMAYLLHIWFQVFPKNPLARRLGISLITLGVLISCLYNYRAYFVAWRYDPTTKATFSHHLN